MRRHAAVAAGLLALACFHAQHVAKPGLGARIKAALSDAALKILSDRVPGRNAVATTIPMEGDLTRPDTKLWPTIAGVIRNAFVSGLADSVDNLPPKEAKGRAG